MREEELTPIKIGFGSLNSQNGNQAVDETNRSTHTTNSKQRVVINVRVSQESSKTHMTSEAEQSLDDELLGNQEETKDFYASRKGGFALWKPTRNTLPPPTVSDGSDEPSSSSSESAK